MTLSIGKLEIKYHRVNGWVTTKTVVNPRIKYLTSSNKIKSLNPYLSIIEVCLARLVRFF